MKKALRVLFYVVMAITGFDIVAWLGDSYWLKIGDPMLREEQAEANRLRDTESALAYTARTVEEFFQERKKIPKSLAAVENGSRRTKDGWNGVLRLERDGKAIWVVSAGPDGVFETEDDLSHEVELDAR